MVTVISKFAATLSATPCRTAFGLWISTGNFPHHDNGRQSDSPGRMAFENTTGSALVNRDNLVSNGVGSTSGLNVRTPQAGSTFWLAG